MITASKFCKCSSASAFASAAVDLEAGLQRAEVVLNLIRDGQ